MNYMEHNAGFLLLAPIMQKDMISQKYAIVILRNLDLPTGESKPELGKKVRTTMELSGIPQNERFLPAS